MLLVALLNFASYFKHKILGTIVERFKLILRYLTIKNLTT